MRSLFAPMLLAGLPPALAQRSFGYGFIGTTFNGPAGGGGFRYGIGGEWGIAPRFGLGGEIGGIQKNGSGAVASANLNFHFETRTRGLDPFLTGGIAGVWLHDRSSA